LDNDKNRRVQSVEVGFTILRVLAENKKAMTLSELAFATDLHKSQLYRYLNSFLHLGVLNRDDVDNPRWSLGPELIALGTAAFDGLDLTHQATPHLLSLKNQLNETIALSIWRDRGPFFVRWEQSNKIVNIGLDTGSYVPLYTATGKIFRAFLSEEITNSLYQNEVLAGNIEPLSYSTEIDQIRKGSISKTDSSLIPGITAVSMPIFYPNHKLAGALSIVGVQGVLDVSNESTLVRELIQNANEISRKLGYTGH
jgi:DNA-binding IclR family transcriptional regulator